MYCSREGSKKKAAVQLLGSGTILREVIAAASCSRPTGALRGHLERDQHDGVAP